MFALSNVKGREMKTILTAAATILALAAPALAEGDADKGAKEFRKCKACHKLEDGANGTGPHLFNVVNRDIGAVDGFGYSGVLAEMGGAWGYEELSGFLANPKAYAKGTKMGFSGLKKPADKANVIGYLQSLGG